MKRFLFPIGFVAVAIFCAVLAWSPARPVDAANGLAGQVKEPQKKAIPPNRILAGEVARILVQARTGPQISAPFRHERGRRGLSQEGQVFGGRYFPHAPGYTREGADKLAKKSSRISVSFVTPIAPASMLSNASRCCNA